VKGIIQDRSAHDVLNLVLVHARVQPVHHILIDDVALLYVDAVNEGQFSGTFIAATGHDQQQGDE
jgi:hypothetical protein